MVILYSVYYETIPLFAVTPSFNFPANVSPITFPPLTSLLITVFKRNPDSYFHIAAQWSRLQDGCHTERVLVTSYGRNCGRCFWYFPSQKKLTKRGSSKKMNHHPSLSLEKETRDVSLTMKYQQDRTILRALMYCINPLMHNAPKWSDTL